MKRGGPLVSADARRWNTWIHLKAQLCQNDWSALMNCINTTIFWLLMQSYKRGTWIALAVKEHLLDLEMLQASVFTPSSCVTFITQHGAFKCLPPTPPPVLFPLWMQRFGDVLHSEAGGVSSLSQSHKKPRGLERKQLLRNEHWLEGQAYLSLTSLWDRSINTLIDLWPSWHSSPFFGHYRESQAGGSAADFTNWF